MRASSPQFSPMHLFKTLPCLLLFTSALAASDDGAQEPKEDTGSVYPEMPAGFPSPRELKGAAAKSALDMALYEEEIPGSAVTFQMIPLPAGSFLIGSPEDEEDRDLSVAYVRNLVSAGVDEIAVYVFAPLPGTALSQSITGYDHYSQLSRSPTWRSDYREVARYRRRMYATFFLSKIIRQPSKVLREARSFIRRRFQTKMEMSVYKQLKIVGLRYAPSIWRRLEEDFLRPAQDSGSS